MTIVLADPIKGEESPLGSAKKDEATRLNYIQWQDLFNRVKPYKIISEAPAGLPRTNFSCAGAPEPEIIHDIRGCEGGFTLEEHGFQVQQQILATPIDFDRQDVIEKGYLPSMEALLKDVFGPRAEVYIFDWKLRSSDRSKSTIVPGATVDLNDPLLCLLPVQRVHVDQSPQGARNRVRYHMGDRADELLKGRFRIVNLWRPIRNTVENFPLAVCDGASVPREKLLAVDHVRKAYIGESLYPLPCPGYRWYYLNRQTKDEVLLFKTYDSSISAPARCCPHTSFEQSDVGPDAMARETIEVKTLVFTDD